MSECEGQKMAYSPRPISDDSGSFGLQEVELHSNEPKAKRQKTGVRNEAECSKCMFGELALYLCYICDIYLCGECLKEHDEYHEYVECENDRRERVKMAEVFVERMRNERWRENKIAKENIQTFTNVNMKCELDKEDCRISGLCGMNDKNLVVLDYNNSCLKVFSPVTYILIRYIRFGSAACGVTELNVYGKATVSQLPSDVKLSTPESALGGSEEKLLAITFPFIKQVWWIDVSKNPASKTKTVKMSKHCESIEVCDGKIYILCRERIEFGSGYSIVILSTEGDHLKEIQNPDLSIGYIEDLAIYRNNVYLNDWINHKVLRIDVDSGNTISQVTLGGSGPSGICIDMNDHIFVCGQRQDKLYRLSINLDKLEQLNLETENMREQERLCFKNDKLYISHDWPSPLCNFVTVVYLT